MFADIAEIKARVARHVPMEWNAVYHWELAQGTAMGPKNLRADDDLESARSVPKQL